MASQLSKREQQIGYALQGFTAAAYIVIWADGLVRTVKHTVHVPFFDEPAVAISEGLILLALTAFFTYRGRRRFAGVGGMLVAIGAGWGNFVLLAFPLLAWAVFVFTRIDRAEMELRRQRRLARKAAKEGRAPTNPDAGGVVARGRPKPSKRYTPPKPPARRRRPRTSGS